MNARPVRNIAFVLLFGAAAGCGRAMEEKVVFPYGTVYYVDGATEDEARRVGEFLTSYEFFMEQRRMSVQLARAGERYQVRIPTPEESLESSILGPLMRGMARGISERALNGAPVDIHLTDEEFATMLEIPFEEGEEER